MYMLKSHYLVVRLFVIRLYKTATITVIIRNILNIAMIFTLLILYTFTLIDWKGWVAFTAKSAFESPAKDLFSW